MSIKKMDTQTERAKALTRLLRRAPSKKLSEAAQTVLLHRNLIRKAMRRGHSLQTLADELHLPKRTLQRHLTLAGLFFRKPRVNNGTVIRRYKTKKSHGN